MAGGRPTVMTEEVLRKLEEAFLLGCSDREACLMADIAPVTLYEYQKLNPEYVERKESLKENPILIARTTVVNGLRSDADLSMKFLERKKKDEFSPSSTINNTHTFVQMPTITKDGEEITFNVGESV